MPFSESMTCAGVVDTRCSLERGAGGSPDMSLIPTSTRSHARASLGCPERRAAMKLRTTRVIQALAVTIAAGALPLTAVATSAAGSTTTGTTAGTTAYCGITWGSLAKSSAPIVRGPLTGVRAGRHACFDRLVIDVTGRAPGFSVQYVNAVYTEGQGALVPLRGGARLRIVAKAPAYTST